MYGGLGTELSQAQKTWCSNNRVRPAYGIYALILEEEHIHVR